MIRRTDLFWLAVACWLSLAISRERPCVAADELMEQRHWRRPIAIAQAESWLFVANRDSGTVSVLDVASRRVIREIKIGVRLSDLKVVVGGRFLLAVDESSHQLLVLIRLQSDLQVIQKLDLAKYPVTLAVAADDSCCTIASLWSRQISVIDLTPLRTASAVTELPARPLAVTHLVSLPFAPRAQKLLSDGRRLVVADAFAGRLAVLETKTGRVVSMRELPGHNIGSLSEDQRRGELLITHQRSRATVATLSENIQWGAVLSNLVRVVPLREFDITSTSTSNAEATVTPAAERPLGGIIYPLGRSEEGAGDPQDISVTSQGQLLVSLSGVSQVALGNHPSKLSTRLAVGQRPTAIAIGADERFAYVANTLDDSISVLDLRERTKVADISLGPQPEIGIVQRGEQLFFDARVSLNGWFSCHSCHTNGHSNGLLNDNFGDGTLGAPKRTLSLLGVADTKPWAWNGRATKLHEQIAKSMRTTMRGTTLPEQIDANAQALEAYVRTLAPAPGLDRARGTLDTAAVERGRLVFEHQKCVTCHQPPVYTSEQSYDVGLHDNVGRKTFNPPSLRGVSQREALFHDNRATQLSDVIDRFRHGLNSELSSGQREELLTFLRSL